MIQKEMKKQIRTLICMVMMAWTLSPLSILAANNNNNYKGVIGLTDTTALTLNPALQRLAGQLLQGKQGSIVAIEPATGRILCLYSHDKVDDGVNRAISKTYSPGSTFKTAQALEMLTEGTLTPEKTYPCHRGFYYNGFHIGCHPHRAPLALVQAIGQSCNAYFCKAFQEMIDNRTAYLTKHRAINRWAQYMHSFGLGRPLGVDIPDEVGGCIPDSAYLRRRHGNWDGTTIMWVGMGQGEVTTTPLQLCNLAAMIANRGWYVTPHIHTTAEEDKQYTVHHQGQASREALHTVILGMRAAVTGGTAASINTPLYKICGKTGTAENEGKDHSIFMGFAPMENPKVAIAVYVENGGFGADLAAPLAALMIEQAVKGHLSPASQQKAKQWKAKNVKITPVKVEVRFDEL